MPNRPGHFEIHADDISRCVDFYTKAFGWKISKWDSPTMTYWMVETGPREEAGGINGGIIKRPCAPSATGMNGYCCTMVVDDYDAMAKKILENGGREAMAKFDIADMAWQGYFIDTEGNTFGLHQVKNKMK